MESARGAHEYGASSPATSNRVDALALRIETRTDAIVAGHAAVRFALAAGFPRRIAGAIGIAASELATNIALHARGRDGWLELRAEGDALELVASDRGAGNPAAVRARLESARAGTSIATPFVPGAGLGCGVAAVGRLMSEVHVEGRAGGGLRIVARCSR